MVRGRDAGLVASAIATGIGVVLPLLHHASAPSPPVRAASAGPITDGYHRIGDDMAPGEWHTDGPRRVNAYGVDAQPHCWFRVWTAATQGSDDAAVQDVHDDVVAPTDVNLTGPVIALETSGCKAWRRV